MPDIRLLDIVQFGLLKPVPAGGIDTIAYLHRIGDDYWVLRLIRFLDKVYVLLINHPCSIAVQTAGICMRPQHVQRVDKRLPMQVSHRLVVWAQVVRLPIIAITPSYLIVAARIVNNTYFHWYCDTIYLK